MVQPSFYDKTRFCIGLYAAPIQLRNREHNTVELVVGKADAHDLLRHHRFHAPAPLDFLADKNKVLRHVVGRENSHEARVANQGFGVRQGDTQMQAVRLHLCGGKYPQRSNLPSILPDAAFQLKSMVARITSPALSSPMLLPLSFRHR